MNLDLGIIQSGSKALHAVLTTEHPNSHNNVPILLVDNQTFEPQQPLPFPCPSRIVSHHLPWTGAGFVCLAGRMATKDDPYYNAAQSYLDQWPQGPHLH